MAQRRSRGNCARDHIGTRVRRGARTTARARCAILLGAVCGGVISVVLAHTGLLAVPDATYVLRGHSATSYAPVRYQHAVLTTGLVVGATAAIAALVATDIAASGRQLVDRGRPRRIQP